MKSVTFRREREATWEELEALVREVEAGGVRRLSPSQVARLPALYRATVSSLSVARAVSLDANLLDYLESLAARAYVAVYAVKTHPLRAIGRFAGRRFPASVRSASIPVALAALAMALGTLAGLALTRQDPARFYAIVPEGLASGRGPGATTEELRAVLYREEPATDLLVAFASWLFTHNSAVGMLAFATGVAAGVPSALLMFGNGLVVGAFGGLYDERGLGLEFWAWTLPHGVTELLAIVLCGAAGLRLGGAVLFPGRHARLRNLSAAGREAAVIVMGAILMLLLAGLVEGIFRQTVQSVPARLLVAATSAVAWAAYFARAGRGGPA